MLSASPSLAGELWLTVDVTTEAEEKKVHLEIPYEWTDVVNLDEDGLKSEDLAKIAKALPEGKDQQVLDATQDGDHVVVHLYHRPDAEGPPGTLFFMDSSGSNIELPIALVAQMAPMAAAMSQHSSAVDVGKCLAKLGGMRPFTMVRIDSPTEKVELGVR